MSSLRFLVIILQKIDNYLPIRIGFIGKGEGSIFTCTQCYDGTQKYPKDYKQMPKVFKSKKSCKKSIKQMRKEDKAFNNEDRLYEIIPIEI